MRVLGCFILGVLMVCPGSWRSFDIHALVNKPVTGLNFVWDKYELLRQFSCPARDVLVQNGRCFASLTRETSTCAACPARGPSLAECGSSRSGPLSSRRNVADIGENVVETDFGELGSARYRSASKWGWTKVVTAGISDENRR